MGKTYGFPYEITIKCKHLTKESSSSRASSRSCLCRPPVRLWASHFRRPCHIWKARGMAWPVEFPLGLVDLCGFLRILKWNYDGFINYCLFLMDFIWILMDV
jgi:hypothetical protein